MEKTEQFKRLSFILFAGLFTIPYLLFIRWPDLYTPIKSFLITSQICLISSVLVFYVLSLKRDRFIAYPVNYKQDIFLAASLLFILLSIAWAKNKLGALYEGIGWFQLICLYFMAPLFIDSDNKIEALLDIFIIQGLIIAVASYYIQAHYPGEPLLLQSRNATSEFLTLPLFLSIYRIHSTKNDIKRFLYWLAFFAALLFIVVGKSRAVWLGVILSFAVFSRAILADFKVNPGYYRRDRIVIIAGFVSLFILSYFYNQLLLARNQLALPMVVKSAFSLEKGSVYNRVIIWINSLALLKDHLILGVGINNWKDVFPLYSSYFIKDINSAYGYGPLNLFLRLATEIGLLGLLPFLLFLLKIWQNKNYMSNSALYMKAALLAVLPFALSHDYNYLYYIGLTKLFFMLIILNCLEEKKQKLFFNKNIFALCAVFISASLALSAFFHYRLAEVAVTDRVIRYHSLSEPGFTEHGSAKGFPSIGFLARINDKPAEGRLKRDRAAEFFIRAYYGGYYRNIYVTLARKCMNEAQDFKKALFWSQKARRLAPDYYDAVYFNALAEYRLGNLTQAKRICEDYFSARQKGHSMRYVYADTLSGLGEREAALTQYKLARQELEAVIARLSQVSLYIMNDTFPMKKEIERKIAALTREGRPQTLSGTLERISKTPEFNKSLAFDAASGKLYFSTNLNGRYDLWSVHLITGDISQVTKFRHLDPFRLRICAAGGKVFFVSDNKGDYNYNIYYWDTDKKEARQLTKCLKKKEDAAEYEISPAGSEAAYILRDKKEGSDLFLVNQAGSETRLTTDHGRKDSLSWSPDSAKVAYVAGEDTIFIYDIVKKENRKIFSQAGYKIKMLNFSKNGERLVFVAEQNDAESQLFELEILTGAIKQLTRGPGRKIFPLHLDGERMVYVKRENDNYLLHLLDNKTGEDSRVGPEEGVVYGGSLLSTPEGLIFLFSDSDNPCTIFSFSFKDNSLKRLIKLDTVAQEDIIPAVRLQLPSDVSGAHVYSFAPAGYEKGRRYPAVIWLHGGSNEFSPRWHIYTQYLANSGFFVFAPNFRDSRDIVNLHEYLTNRQDIDASRIYVIGVSSAAFYLEKLIKDNPALFSRAIEYVGVATGYLDVEIKGLPPLKVFLSANDAIVDNERKIRQIKLQREAGNKAAFRVFENEGHDLRDIENTKIILKEAVDFLRDPEKDRMK